MASRNNSPVMEEEDDIVEIKKAMATNATARESASAVSSVPPIVCYCLASILMTVINKFVVSGRQFNMTFLLLCIQSSVSVLCVIAAKRIGLISFRDFDVRDARTWFPISFMLVSVIYTGSKSLQYLSIPVYTIFKNLTIILIAYGEVIWFGGRITCLTFISFVLMVLSSVIAAWADISDALTMGDPAVAGGLGMLVTMKGVVTNLNIGYIWMFTNCAASATYVLSMRKRIRATGFSDWDTMFYNNLLSIPVLAVFSIIAEDWGTENLSSNFPESTRNFLLFAIAFSGAAAVAISYTTAWCIRATSSTTYSMVGALNKLPVAASGMIFFGDPVTFGSVSAVGAGFFAGLVYATAKNMQKKAENATVGQSVIPMSRKPSQT